MTLLTSGRFILGVAMYLFATNSALATVNYAYDDGAGNTNVGPPSSFPSDPEMGWGNYFTAQPGGELITEIHFAMGPTFPVDRPVTVALFDDPDDDGDPRNATLLTTATLDPPSSGDTFNVAPIMPSEVSGAFFVAVFAWAEAGVDRPARQDTGGPSGHSWLIYNPVEQGANLNDLGANAYIENMQNIPGTFPGVWMIRAVGEPLPPDCPADITKPGDGVVDVFDLFMLLGNWNADGPGANLAAPFDVVDVFDLFVLLDAWGDCP